MDQESYCEERTRTTLDTEKDKISRASQVRPSFGDVPSLIPASQNGPEQYSNVTSGQEATQAIGTGLSTQVMEYYNRLCDTHSAPSTTCRPCSLPPHTTWNILTKGSQPEITIANGNYSTQGVKRFGVDVEVTRPSQSAHRNRNEEHFRNVIGQETKTTYVPHASKTAVLESAPRERKRWVRPPLVGQASTCDSSAAMQDKELPAVSNMGTEEGSVQEELLRHTYADKETIHSRAIKETQLCKEFSPFNSSTDDNDLKLHSLSQGKEDKTETCRDVEVLCEIREDFVRRKAEEDRDVLFSGRVFMMLPGPGGNQYQTYMSSGQTQDSSAVSTEAVGSCRAPSPASVSSVTSSRRLEWDSGADVGYQNYRPENGEPVPNDALSTIERIALTRGCSAALRLEPEGTAASVQQLNTVPFKPTEKSPRYVSTAPLAISTPVEIGQRVPSSTTQTDSECEITPVVKMKAERCICNGEAHSCHLAKKKSTSVAQQKVQGKWSKGHEGCNVLSKKISSSLSNLHEHRHNEVSENSLRRSQSHLSLLSKEDYKTKATQDSDNNSYSLHHQHKRNRGIATCSLSSSSISTVIPNHEYPKMPNTLIQTTAFNVPARNSVGIQVSETERDCKTACVASYLSPEDDNSALKCVAAFNPEREIMLEGTDSDIIDKTDSNAAEDTRTAKRNPKHVSVVKRNYINTSQVQPQSHHEMKHQKLQGNRKIENQNCGHCKGMHRRGSSECQWRLIADGTPQKLIASSADKLNNDIHKPSLQMGVNQSEEDATEKNSGTLDSVTSSTRTTGSWFLGETPQSANENQNVSGRRGSSGVVGSANSFEYLPGHVYENNSHAVDKYLCKNTTVGGLFSECASSEQLACSAENKFEAIHDKSWGSSVSSTFARDIEKSIAVLKDLLHSKSYNSDKKNKLIQQVMNRLIDTNCAEDKGLPKPNIPWVHHKLPVPTAGHAVQASQEEMSEGHKMRRTVERGEVSGDSGSEQQSGSNPQPVTPAALHQAYCITDRGVQSGNAPTMWLYSLSTSVSVIFPVHRALGGESVLALQCFVIGTEVFLCKI
jgi:hypothetical protein